MTFNDLKLSAPLLKAVSEAGYETPSPIQASAIPPVLEGRDLMGCAQTGTGKTAAFALPMLDRLSAAAPRKKGAVRALILTPTRELALQIGESFDAYGKYLKLRSTVIFGGVGQAPQVEAIRRGGEAHPKGRGHPHRLPGPSERPHRTGPYRPVEPRGLCAGRGRPDAGHGLCA